MVEPPPQPPRGRGASSNPPNRYAATHAQPEDDGWGGAPEPAPRPATALIPEPARSMLTTNDSPDIPFELSLNPYRGCEHGCAYCFARPSHAYLGYSPGLDFETRILFKPDSAPVLRRELAARRYRCRVLALGPNTDPYQPAERQLQVTRGLLELLAECRHPLELITKSALVERDLDLLAEMGRAGLARVVVSVTTLDRTLARDLEPRAAAPQRRLQTIARLTAAGVPVTVLVAPVIPMLTDPELERILAAAREAGADAAGWILLRLPGEVAGLFTEWLQAQRPELAGRVLARLKEAHGGRLYDPRFGHRMRGQGAYAELIGQRFDLAWRRLGFRRPPPLDTAAFRPPAASKAAGPQRDLFD